MLEQYRLGQPLTAKTNHLWPLYGAGMENLGREGKFIEVPMPVPGPDQLLVRHDACGLCFSDIKVIRQGQSHPRIFKDISVDPVVLGHEVTLTVVGVGDSLKEKYRPGDRYIVQAEIYKDGVNYAYGYMIQGGLSEYAVVDQRVLNGDHGCYLLPVKPQTGYAESALTEPWACVTAAYGLTYRTGLKPGGVTWIIGTSAASDREYRIGDGFGAAAHPGQLFLTNVPESFRRWLVARAADLGVRVTELGEGDAPPLPVDDLVLLAPTPEMIESTSSHLADFGICAIIATEPMPRKVSLDVGRIHYNRWAYVGGLGPDIAAAYSDVPIRSALRSGGAALFVGAGGPMGRMHVQRAIQVHGRPAVIVCSDVSDLRLNDLSDTFGAEAAANGIEFICLNPMNRDAYAQGMERFRAAGFDDVVVLAPVAAVISDAATWLAPRGVMNVFAGVPRGTMCQIEAGNIYLRQARHIGHSASSIEDLRFMLYQAESGELSPNRSVAAIGSLEAVPDGLQALMDTTFPGKVVIYPHIKEMPLTAITDLKDRMPSVYALLRGGREWTNAAEVEFLRLMLKDGRR